MTDTQTLTLVFLDTETTGLRPDRRVWDLALITRRPGEADQEWQRFVGAEDLDLANADPFGLKVGKFYDRHPQMNATGEDPFLAYGQMTTEAGAMWELEGMTRDAIIVGAVVNFDTEVLDRRMRHHGLLPSWRYHLVDVETLAAGQLGLTPPWNFDGILERYGLSYSPEDRHTALGDARMVRDLYDAVILAHKPSQDTEMDANV